MSKNELKSSELILNDDGSVYHIHLKNEHIADTVILVGDQGRVERISRHFERVEHRISNREFTTHVGWYNGKRITVMSTGIGTDNIDIAVNELDAAANIDPATRSLRPVRRRLNFIRIGTSGALQKDIPVGSFVIAEFGLGFDGLLYYYNYEPDPLEKMLTSYINAHLNWNKDLSVPYIIGASRNLVEALGEGMIRGITATATGFYGPQGRQLYLELKDQTINERLTSFHVETHRVTNFEMETSALYALGKMLGHHCCTCCAIIANRATKDYLEDYQSSMDALIRTVLDRL